MPERSTIVVGTRASELAVVQTAWVVAELSRRFATLRFELRKLSTRGDRDRQSPLSSMNVQGVFTSELESALLKRDIDVAVHSFKDLPTEVTEGLSVAAVPERAGPYDVLVLRETGSLRKLPAGARVAAGSPRRRLALQCVRQDLDLVTVRGNVDTRLAKLTDGEYDALVMAQAALERLRRTEITESLENVMLPAAAQGALAVQVRTEDEATQRVVAVLNDVRSARETTAEREVLRGLGGGCHLPLGVLARADELGNMTLRAQTYLAGEAREFARQGKAADARELAGKLVDIMRRDFPDGLPEPG